MKYFWDMLSAFIYILPLHLFLLTILFIIFLAVARYFSRKQNTDLKAFLLCLLLGDDIDCSPVKMEPLHQLRRTIMVTTFVYFACILAISWLPSGAELILWQLGDNYDHTFHWIVNIILVLIVMLELGYPSFVIYLEIKYFRNLGRTHDE